MAFFFLDLIVLHSHFTTSYWHCLLFLWEPEAFKQAMTVKSCVRWLMSWSTSAVWWVYGQALLSNLQATSSFLQAASITKALWSGILTAVKPVVFVFLCPFVLLLSATHLMFGFHWGGTCVTSAESLQLAKFFTKWLTTKRSAIQPCVDAFVGAHVSLWRVSDYILC